VKAVVVGAGIGGLSVAAGLLRNGVDVDVFEQAETLRPEGEAISFWANGCRALAALGFVPPIPGERIKAMDVQDHRGRHLMTIDLAPISARLGHPSVSVRRSHLLRYLADRVPADRLHFRHKVSDVRISGRYAEVSFADGSRARGDVVIGADGVWSAVRRSLVGDTATFLRWLSWQGLAPRDDRADPEGRVVVTTHRSAFAGIFPDGPSLTWFFDSRTQEHEPAVDDPKRWLLSRFSSWPRNIVDAVAATDPNRIRCYPVYAHAARCRWAWDRAVLIGDAAHAMAPALGQGGSQAVEDALVLVEEVSFGDGHEITRALRRYERRRRSIAIRTALGARAVQTLRATSLAPLAARLIPPSLASLGLVVPMRPVQRRHL
jgi:FAD-dependent urate hydroxylase